MYTHSTTPVFIHRHLRPRVRAVAAAIVMFLSGYAVLAGEKNAFPNPNRATPFSRIVVLGDSLSDTGNLSQLTGGGLPGELYFDGRFSNGPLWIEYLAEGLRMQLFAENVYAVAGATTGHDNSNDGELGLEYPGLQDQVAAFLAAHPQGADPEALYTVWAGPNDFFETLARGGSAMTLISQGVANTAAAVQSLHEAGARHILVLNVPDLGLTPAGRASGMSDAITQLSAAYNKALGSALQSLAEAGIPTIRVDAFATVQMMVDSPAEFGFTNVTAPYLLVGGDPSGFLFWDIKHPTIRAHRVLGEEALDRLIDYFSPRQGDGTPDARVNALHGLVRAR